MRGNNSFAYYPKLYNEDVDKKIISIYFIFQIIILACIIGYFLLIFFYCQNTFGYMGYSVLTTKIYRGDSTDSGQIQWKDWIWHWVKIMTRLYRIMDVYVWIYFETKHGRLSTILKAQIELQAHKLTNSDNHEEWPSISAQQDYLL